MGNGVGWVVGCGVALWHAALALDIDVTDVCEFESPAQAWARHASVNGLTTGNCQWARMMGEYVRNNFSCRYKTTQLYDFSKRLYNSLTQLGVLQAFTEFCGEWVDFQSSELNSLATMQNLHLFCRIIQTLSQSYPDGLLSVLFLEGCKFLAACQQSCAMLCDFVLLA